MTAHDVRIEWDEDGCTLNVATDNGVLVFVVADPEALYDSARTEIGPWLYERDTARLAYDIVGGGNPHTLGTRRREEGYELTDPKHPRHHQVFADTAMKGA